MTGRATAVLISGSGSNLQALLDAATEPNYPARISLVLSNRADAYGLVRAANAGVPNVVVDHKAYGSREAFETEIDRHLAAAGIDLVCLAGFMRVLTPGFVERWRDRMINVHPSLLPAFRGLHTHDRALAAGCAVAGCSVHLVRPELDDGPILVQGVVPVLSDDDGATLAARVLTLEHRCYPRGLAMLAADRVHINGGRATLVDEKPGERVILHPMLRELSR